ncbi:SGNH/GDSL hydrolase family protein [Salipaludibacillus sp. HK11]|uniref:SGNH/GDSL hydrolase family protein n=1 Tax=Salipaludibacillus sp. HK11 TaxID=3394320 RepID=UPI0039FBA52C
MKLLFRSSILLLAVTIFSANVSGNYENENTREVLVALGDSIPYGFNLGDDNLSPSGYAYPSLIGLDADIRVPNLTVPGWKTEDMLAALESDKYSQAIGNADYITLNIGSNDLIDSLFSAWILTLIDDNKSFEDYFYEEVEENDVFANIKGIILKIRDQTDAPVIIYNIYNPFQKTNPIHDVAIDVLPGINQIFNEYVAELNVTEKNILLADAYQAFGTNQANYVIDGGNNPDIHPTLAGQRKLADIGLEALETYKQRELRGHAMEKAIVVSHTNLSDFLSKPEPQNSYYVQIPE